MINAIATSSLRTPETFARYEEFKKQFPANGKCRFCGLQYVHKFGFWKICENAFPYDAVFSVSHLLIPIRHVERTSDISLAELFELNVLRNSYLEDNYHLIMENLGKRRSIDHVHFHLLVYK